MADENAERIREIDELRENLDKEKTEMREKVEKEKAEIVSRLEKENSDLRNQLNAAKVGVNLFKLAFYFNCNLLIECSYVYYSTSSGTAFV